MSTKSSTSLLKKIKQGLAVRHAEYPRRPIINNETRFDAFGNQIIEASIAESAAWEKIKRMYPEGKYVNEKDSFVSLYRNYPGETLKTYFNHVWNGIYFIRSDYKVA